MPGNANLRRDLDVASAIRIPDVYRETLDRLAQKYDHAISILDGKNRIARFNCFTYGLGIGDRPDFNSFVDRASNSAILQSSAVQKMIAEGVLVEIEAIDAHLGDVVIYFTRIP